MNIKPTVVYAFAGFYLFVLTYAWLFTEPAKLATGDYFAQAALILAAIGLYHAPNP